MANLETVRARLVRLCESKRTRRVVFTANMPSRWQPRQFTDPSTRQAFTDESAWSYIIQALAQGASIEEITLEHPPGATGYVLLLPGANSRKIYVKLQICGDHVRGRSFHESEFDRGDDASPVTGDAKCSTS